MLNRSASLAMSTSVLKALPGKLDIKRHSPSILYYMLSYFSDMRVSENTKSIVQKLLVMNPKERLTASQVLDSLGSVIATWLVLP